MLRQTETTTTTTERMMIQSKASPLPLIQPPVDTLTLTQRVDALFSQCDAVAYNHCQLLRASKSTTALTALSSLQDTHSVRPLIVNQLVYITNIKHMPNPKSRFSFPIGNIKSHQIVTTKVTRLLGAFLRFFRALIFESTFTQRKYKQKLVAILSEKQKICATQE